METVTLSRHRTPKGRWYTVRDEHLDTGEHLLQVLEDTTVTAELPGEGHDFFTHPIGVARWNGSWQWLPPQVAGKPMFPKFCEIVAACDIDEWIETVAPLVDEEIDDNFDETTRLLHERIAVVQGKLDAGMLDVDDIPRAWAPSEWEVALDEDADQPALWAWAGHPEQRFDPASDTTIDVTVAVETVDPDGADVDNS